MIVRIAMWLIAIVNKTVLIVPGLLGAKVILVHLFCITRGAKTKKDGQPFLGSAMQSNQTYEANKSYDAHHIVGQRGG